MLEALGRVRELEVGLGWLMEWVWSGLEWACVEFRVSLRWAWDGFGMGLG